MASEAAAHLDNPAWAIERLQDIVPTFRWSKSSGSPSEYETVELSDEAAMRQL